MANGAAVVVEANITPVNGDSDSAIGKYAVIVMSDPCIIVSASQYLVLDSIPPLSLVFIVHSNIATILTTYITVNR